MNDVSGIEPMEEPRKWNPERRCTAHRKNGDRCRKAAILGGNVCATHGGRARQVRAKAQQRLAEATDLMAKSLLKMATDCNVSDSVKLAAIRDALDRGGVGIKAEIELTAKPYEAVFEQIDMQGGSRAEHRHALGVEDDDQAALPAGDAQPIDVLVVSGDELDDLDNGHSHDLNRYRQPVAPDERERDAAFDSAGQESPFERATPPLDSLGLMSLDDAVAAQAAMRREVTRQHREPRALPPGKSSR
jgi:hypothetical protein